MTNKIPSVLRSITGSYLLILLTLGANSIFAFSSNSEQSGFLRTITPELVQNEHIIQVKNWQIYSKEHDISADIIISVGL